MSSNLLKGNWIQFQNEEARVIDSNAVLERRMQSGGSGCAYEQGLQGAEAYDENAKEESSEGFQGGLAAEELDGLLADSENSAMIIKAVQEESEVQPAPQAPVYDGPSPEELLAEAQMEIEQMKQDARTEIENARKDAADKGYQDGFRQGTSQGYNDGMTQADAELAAARSRLEEDYMLKLQKAEPEMVHYLTNIYEHVFRVEIAERKDLILHLLSNCMQQIEGSRDYIIHVSGEDYAYVSEQKPQLFEAVGNNNSTIEVITDITLKKNECMIETDGGIYDCSLDVQLKALRNELRLLSYEDGMDGT